jgi:hypothetical protein
MEWIEKTKLVAALYATVLGATLVASPAQARGGGASAPAPRTGGPIGLGRQTAFAHRGQQRFFNGSTFPPPACFDPNYNQDDESVMPDAAPAQELVAPPAQPPAPEPTPAETLVIEYRDGHWVRIPTGSQLPVFPQSDSAQASSLRPVVASPKESALPLRALPPAVLMFRDGHKEEVERYMIQGDVIYTSADYWSTGSWTRKIYIAELDVPGTLKLNQQRGGKFSLPSGPSEVVVRF